MPRRGAVLPPQGDAAQREMLGNCSVPCANSQRSREMASVRVGQRVVRCTIRAILRITLMAANRCRQ